MGGLRAALNRRGASEIYLRQDGTGRTREGRDPSPTRQQPHNWWFLTDEKETDMLILARSHFCKTLALLLLILATAGSASGGTIVPLNTGYNHQIFAPYPAVTSTTSTTNDNYWINIASYPPTNPPVAPSWVLRIPPAPWAPAFPATNWISARNTVLSPSITSKENPAYTIFRKCFCLLPNFKNPSLTFQVRADDTVQAWFNTQLNVALQPALGNWNFGQPLPSLPSNPGWFRAGKNCIYVLLEDFGGHMGFDLVGTIQADGLAPLPAFGVDQKFECPCRGDVSPTRESQASMADDDREVVGQLLKIAEKRRLERAKAPGVRQP
jgi:hypothetical protein